MSEEKNQKKAPNAKDARVNPIAEAEEKVLKFWQENKIFEKTLAKDAPKGEFVFYEGPPTANGKPGIHHLEARAFKDLVPRYKTMQGYHVRRKGGWDTHGLPVELQVEKQLGLKSKKEIEAYGIEKFNEECKKSVWEYLDIWNKFTHRVGYWIDQDNPYVTYKNDYIESVWNVLKNVADKDLLYKDYKVVPWCPRCGTALSSHELAQGYQEVKDISVYVKFKIVGFPNAYFLAWTTTPWTLPGNVALAVGKDVEYVEAKVGEEILVFAKKRLNLIEGDYEIVATHKGSEVVGMEYEPLYDYMSDSIEAFDLSGKDKAFKVYEADFVNTEDGTGIVHTAVMYGQDDFELGTKIGLPKYHLVLEDGHFKIIQKKQDDTESNMKFLSGRFVKDDEVAIDIVRDLANRKPNSLLFKKEKYEHSYPFCWRCKTPLIYYARDSWYIKMSSLRDELVKENEDINWEPAHIRDGRFGEWLREVKDWAISRERYWGTPLPVWQDQEGNKIVIGSIDELRQKVKKSGNKYFIMRHGEADHNIHGRMSSLVDNPDHLTDKGKKEVVEAASKLKAENIDLIVASPLVRTRETASLLAEELGLAPNQIIIEEKIHENLGGVFEGKPVEEWRAYREALGDKINDVYEGGESLVQIRFRMLEAVFDLEKKYQNKKIVIIGHGLPLRVLEWSAELISLENIVSHWEDKGDIDVGQFAPLNFWPFPHNKGFELDLHRPFIDEVTLLDDKGNELTRVKEVMDVWFDSGAMPLAQNHYPFENKDWVDGPGYPADFIAEAIDQTRGWFYTLHAIGILLGRGKAYKNVICLGHILDDKGKKMSKSVGNIVDPWEMIDKYGVDALRLWMYSVNQPGDSKNFDEKTVGELVRKNFNLLTNVASFYELNLTGEVTLGNKSDNILDRWIISRLNELLKNGTEALDRYKIFEATRSIRDFIDDLSTWYIRRSRDRFKSEDSNDKQKALATTKFVLLELAKYLAPFAPFYAEDLYQKLKSVNDPESVHLCMWPEVGEVDEEVLGNMSEVRRIVSLGLEARASATIKVRQPLKELRIKNYELRNKERYLELIKDEVNVKEVVFDEKLAEEVKLDTEITPGLKVEGDIREAIRTFQEARKNEGLDPGVFVSATLSATANGQKLIEENKEAISGPTQVKNFEFGAELPGDKIGFEKIKLTKLG